MPFMYPEPGSNRHSRRNWFLRPARLPIPPSGHELVFIGRQKYLKILRNKFISQKINILNYTFEKTILGSIVFFISTLIISLITIFVYCFSITEILISSLMIASVNTLIELVSSKGIDNLSVSLITKAILIFMN